MADTKGQRQRGIHRNIDGNREAETKTDSWRNKH